MNTGIYAHYLILQTTAIKIPIYKKERACSVFQSSFRSINLVGLKGISILATP